MLFSGADLIRTSGQQQARAERIIEASGVAPVAGRSSDLDEEMGNALQRFARFIHKESAAKKDAKKEPRKPLPATVKRGPHLYWEAEERRARLDDFGRLLDIYA